MDAIIGLVGGLLAGGVLKVIFDKVGFILISKNQDKLQKYIVKKVEELDNKYIDPYKKKFPEVGGIFEKLVAATLIQCADKILDK